MDIRDIETFLELDQQRNFGRTAEKLYISQTAVSARIKSLEQELKVTLFTRNTHMVELTPAGHQFLSFAKQFYTSLENAKKDMLFTNRFQHFITIGAPDSVWTSSLVSALNSYINTHPNYCFKMLCAHSSAVISRILDRSIDIGFVLRKPLHVDIESIPFQTSSFYLVGRPDIKLPAERLTRENIFSFPLIEMFWGQTFTEWYKTYYPPFAYMMEVDQTSVLTKFLLAGTGVSFLPERHAREYLSSGQLKAIPFDYQEKMPIEQSYAIFLKSNDDNLMPLLTEIRNLLESVSHTEWHK